MSEHLFMRRAVVQFVHSYVYSHQDEVLCVCVTGCVTVNSTYAELMVTVKPDKPQLILGHLVFT